MTGPLQPAERREKIVGLLHEGSRPLTGSKLAECFGVSRQVIVQDIALLRAEGHNIIATSQGYVVPGRNMGFQCFTLACQHTEAEVRDELLTMVNNGARVVDVIVEHPIYGELRGLLMIQTREDVENFMSLLGENKARLLSSLTGGVHLHTIEVLNCEVLKLVKARLNEKGYLVRE